MSNVTDLLQAPEWNELTPKQRATGRERLWDVYLEEDPARQEFFTAQDEKTQAELRQEFQERVDKARPDVFTVVVTPERKMIRSGGQQGLGTRLGAMPWKTTTETTAPAVTRPLMDPGTEEFLEVVGKDPDVIDWDGMDAETLMGTLGLINAANPKLAEQLKPKAQAKARQILEERRILPTREQELEEVETTGGKVKQFSREVTMGAAKLAEGAAIGPGAQLVEAFEGAIGFTPDEKTMGARESRIYHPENVALRRLAEVEGEWQTAVGSGLAWAGGINALLRGGISALPKVPLKGKDGLNVVNKAGKQVMRSPGFRVDPLSRQGLAVAAGGDAAAGAFYGTEYGPTAVAEAFGVEPSRLTSAIEGTGVGAAVGILFRQASNAAVANRVRKMPQFADIPQNLSNSEFVKRAATMWGDIYEEQARAAARATPRSTTSSMGSEFAGDVAEGAARPNPMLRGSVAEAPAPPTQSTPTTGGVPAAGARPARPSTLGAAAPTPELAPIVGGETIGPTTRNVNPAPPKTSAALLKEAEGLSRNKLRQGATDARKQMRLIEQRLAQAGPDEDMTTLTEEYQRVQERADVFAAELKGRPPGKQFARLAPTDAAGNEDAISLMLDFAEGRRIPVADESMFNGLSRELRPFFRKGPYSDRLYEDFPDTALAEQMSAMRPDEQVSFLMSHLESALQGRKALAKEMKTAEYQGKVHGAFFDNVGRSVGQRTAVAKSIDEARVGESFRQKDELFKVTDVDPETGVVTVKDGVEIEVPPGTEFYVDRGIVEAPPYSAPAVDDPFAQSPQEYVQDAVSRGQAFKGQLLEDYGIALPEGYRLRKGLAEPSNAGPKLTKQAAKEEKQVLKGEGEDLNLKALTPEQQAAEAARLEAQQAARKQREAIAEGQARPLTGDSSDVGQGRLFAEDEDLFSGAAQERAGGEAGGTAGRASVDPGGGGRPGPAAAQGANPEPMVVELPEIVQFTKELLGGRYPKVLEAMRMAGGRALGIFRPVGPGSIELRADIFKLVTDEEKAAMKVAAEDYAKRNAGPGDNVAEIARERFRYLYQELFNERAARDPVQAVKTIAHELGHAVDYLPEQSMARGNILGRFAGLKRYMRHAVPLDPNQPHGKPLTSKDRAELRKQARKAMEKEVGPFEEVVRTILVEEPVFRSLDLTPDDVRRLFAVDGRETLPHLYEWFAQQSRQVKKEIVRAAMQGIVDERLKALGGSREQVGTRTVERTVRERTGRQPTHAEVEAKFRELLREEIVRRNLAELKQVREELIELSDWWRPGLKEATGAHRQYRMKGEELYADMFSVLLNNPAELLRRAPTAWQLWVNHLDAKPEVKAFYNALQDDIRSGAVHRDRVRNLRKAFDESDQRSVDIEAMTETPKSERLDAFRLFFDRQFGPIYRRMDAHRQRRKDPQALLDEEQAIKNFIYKTSQTELLLRRADMDVYEPLLRANLDVRDLDELMFHNRVARERAEMANPLGFSPASSGQRLEEMERTLGPERWAELNRIRQRYHEIRTDLVLNRLKEFKVMDAEFVDRLIANPDYATFSVSKDAGPLDPNSIESVMQARYGNELSAKIFAQVGTLQEIKSPFASTLSKDMSLLSFAYRERAKAAVVEAMIQANDPMIRPANKRWDPKTKRQVPEVVENERIATLQLIRDGKLEGFYVPKAISEMFKHGDAIQNTILGDVLYRVTGWQKGAFAALNYGFWPVGHWRDIRSWERRMPGHFWEKGALRGIPGGRFIPQGKKRYLKYYPKAAKAAFDSVYQRQNPIADEALRRGLLISREDPYAVIPTGQKALDRLLLKFGQTPASWKGEGEDKVNAFVRMWAHYKKFGEVAERTSKIAGMLMLDEHYPKMPEGLKQRMIHQWAGSPDFLEKGRGNALVDTVMLFYNPWKQSKRSEWRAWKDRPMDKAAHLVANTALLTAGLWALQEGLLKPILEKRMSPEEADDLAEMMRAIPDRDKNRFHVIPLFWVDKERGKVAYLALHLEEEERLANAAFRAALKGGMSLDEMQGAVAYAGGELPGGNPVLKTATAWFEFMFLGQNPYDSFLQRNILSDDEHEAGKGWAPMAKWTFNNLSANLFGRFGHESTIDPEPTTLERILRAPVVSNIAGRWIRVSNRGYFEEDDKVTEDIRQERALLRLVGQEIIGKLQAPVDPDKPREVLSRKEKDLLLEKPYLMEYVSRSLTDRTLQKNDFLWRRLQRVDSLEERLKLLQSWKQFEEKTENQQLDKTGTP